MKAINRGRVHAMGRVNSPHLSKGAITLERCGKSSQFRSAGYRKNCTGDAAFLPGAARHQIVQRLRVYLLTSGICIASRLTGRERLRADAYPLSANLNALRHQPAPQVVSKPDSHLLVRLTSKAREGTLLAVYPNVCRAGHYKIEGCSV
jgi:hypothetical protein